MDNVNETYWKVWEYLVRLVRDEVERTSQSAVAKRIGVSRSAVNRWVHGIRGERVELSNCLRIVQALGGDLAMLARDLGYKEVAQILELSREKQQTLLDLLELLMEGGPVAEKLEQEIEFLKQLKRMSTD